MGADPSAIEALRTLGAFLAGRGWLPATSGNLSFRVDATTIAITRSGVDKSSIVHNDVIAMNLDAPLPAGVSAETPLHVARYRADASIGAVLHVHSVASTVLSRQAAKAGELVVEGYEMQKSLAGVRSHEGTLKMPVFPNSQDMPALAREVEARLAKGAAIPGYLLAGHGLYAWGRDLAEARRHVEGIEFLLACSLEERRLAK